MLIWLIKPSFRFWWLRKWWSFGHHLSLKCFLVHFQMLIWQIGSRKSGSQSTEGLTSPASEKTLDFLFVFYCSLSIKKVLSRIYHTKIKKSVQMKCELRTLFCYENRIVIHQFTLMTFFMSLTSRHQFNLVTNITEATSDVPNSDVNAAYFKSMWPIVLL